MVGQPQRPVQVPGMRKDRNPGCYLRRVAKAVDRAPSGWTRQSLLERRKKIALHYPRPIPPADVSSQPVDETKPEWKAREGDDRQRLGSSQGKKLCCNH